MEGKWELADDDKTVLVEPGKGVIAYFRYAKDAEMAVKAPAMAEALEDIARWAEELGYYAEPGTRLAPVFQRARAILATIKGDARERRSEREE